MTWVMDWSTAASIAANPQAVAAISEATIYEIVRVGGTVAPGLPAIATLDFKSVTQMQAAFAAGQVNSWDHAVVYDPEHWSATPLSEQQNVVAAMGQAEQLAAQQHLALIATPATDLMEVLTPGPGTLAEDYVGYDLAGRAAASGASVVDIQAQALETDLSSYQYQIASAMAQIHSSNASAAGLGDVTDHLGSATVPVAQVVAAIRATEGEVRGYFLNAPAEGGAIVQALG